VRHIEFIHTDHFEKHYHRQIISGRLSLFIDFCWQTDFDNLWAQYPKGFSDLLFPNLGYTYLINLGTPFTMQVDQHKTLMKGDGFLPRFNHIEAFHKPGNSLFGIKFKVSPIIFEKKVNFSEYSGSVYPLSYLMEPKLISAVKQAGSFVNRVKLLSRHYEQMVDTHAASMNTVNIVTSILQQCEKRYEFNPSIEALADRYHISDRTLSRYFETAVGMSCKKALQVLRIRRAIGEMTRNPEIFDLKNYGYYDASHFYKHLRQFLNKDSYQQLNPYLQLLQSVKKNKAGKNTGPTHTYEN
jgi:AraC-like DNA-binding protein